MSSVNFHEVVQDSCCSYFFLTTLMCLSIGTPKNNKFSICSKWKIHYFQVSQNLGIVQPHYDVLEYWDM